MSLSQWFGKPEPVATIEEVLETSKRYAEIVEALQRNMQRQNEAVAAATAAIADLHAALAETRHRAEVAYRRAIALGGLSDPP